MKKFISAVLSLLMLSCVFTGVSFAAEDEDITSKFTDTFFLDAVLVVADKNADGKITKSEAEAVTEMEIWGWEITSINGIEYFTNMERLTLSDLNLYNENYTLNVSHMKNLVYLDCSWNSLAGLDVSGCAKLETLRCDGNYLTSLDISKNLALKELVCYSNEFSSLDLSAHTELQILRCGGGYSFTSLTLPKSGKLETLEIYDGELRSIDLSGQSGLKRLSLAYVPIMSIDFSDVPKLEELNVDSTKIIDLDLSKLKNLSVLYCGYSDYLRELDVSRNTNLVELSIAGTVLESIDISKNTKLESLYVSGSGLKELDISKNLALTSLSCGFTEISYLDLSRQTELTYLSCWRASLSSLDLSKNTKLEYIDVGQNYNLTELILPKTNTLQILYCSNTALTSLDLSGYPNLVGISCYGTKIEKLDLSSSHNIEWIDCENSAITELILPESTPNLSTIFCAGNKLTSITDVLGTKNMDMYYFDYYPQNVEQNDGWDRFSDVSRDSWFYEDVKFMVVNALVPRSLQMDYALVNQSYGVQENITRGELVESLYAAAMQQEMIYDWWYCPFEDVVEWSQREAVAWAAANGIVNGVDETHFNPTAPLTRQDLATILVRFANYMKIELPENGIVTFSDSGSISDYAAEHVKTLANSGIIKGMEDGSFAPQGNVTRAQIAALLHRILTI